MKTDADGLLTTRFAATKDLHDDSDWADVLRRRQPGRVNGSLLNCVESVTLTQKRGRRRTFFVAGFTAAVLLGTGVAIAAGVNPFAGIGAAGHGQAPKDVLAQTVLARIASFNNPNGTLSSGSLVPGSSRLLGQLRGGRKIYVATTTKKYLCILVTNHGNLLLASYGNALTQAEPITVGSFVRVKNGPNATLPLSYGIAKDGITAVSFMAHGIEKSVPVKDNVWFYEGRSNVLGSITIHYTDGHTQTLTH
jgi:hypothetical protein